jgi:hypothetical protein
MADTADGLLGKVRRDYPGFSGTCRESTVSADDLDFSSLRRASARLRLRIERLARGWNAGLITLAASSSTSAGHAGAAANSQACARWHHCATRLDASKDRNVIAVRHR